MTDQERQEAIDKAIKERNEAIAARKQAEIKAGFLNPLGEGTSYAEFLDQVGKKTIEEYCKGQAEMTDEVIAWIKQEINLLKK